MGIKVLQLISGNDNGGGGNHVLSICMYSSEKFQTVLGCIGKGPLYEKAKLNKVETVLFSSNSAINGELVSYIKKNKFDLVNMHGAKLFFMHVFIKRKLDIPCVATVHSDYRYDFNNNKLKKIVFTQLSRLGLKSFNYYIGVSKEIVNILNDNKFKGEKFQVDNGLDFSKTKIIKKREEILKECNLNIADFIFVSVGRLHPIKNHKTLIRAFYLLRQKYKTVKLLIVGDGELRRNLEDLVDKLEIKDSVVFTGFKNNSLDYVNASDIEVLCSFSEGGNPPLAILECAAIKKPVIVSNVGDLSSLIKEEDNGFKVDPNSVEDIELKMSLAYENKVDIVKYGKKLHDLVKSKFTIEAFIDKYLNIYLKILRK